MDVKMIVCDYDGTLCNTAKEVSKRTEEAVKAFTENGGRFVICTTRPYVGIADIAKNLGLSNEIISNQGASIKNLSDGTDVFLETFSKDQVKEILNLFDKISNHIFVSGNDEMKSKKDDLFMKIGIINAGYPLTKTDTTLIDECDNFDIAQILVGSYFPPLVYLYYALAKLLFGKKYEIGLCDRFLINFVPKNTGKGKAIERIAKLHSIDKSEITAFGDSVSDYPMFEYSGCGVAVGNAKPELKKRADKICGHCNYDGVAKYIEENCL